MAEPANDWDDESRELLQWFNSARGHFPRSPFLLWPWCNVSDPDRFLAMLELDVAAGPTGPRARRGALQDDLRRLREIFHQPRPTTTRQMNLLVGSEAAAL